MVDDDDAVEMPRVPSLGVVVAVAVAAVAVADDGYCCYGSVERWTHDLA